MRLANDDGRLGASPAPPALVREPPAERWAARVIGRSWRRRGAVRAALRCIARAVRTRSTYRRNAARRMQRACRAFSCRLAANKASQPGGGEVKTNGSKGSNAEDDNSIVGYLLDQQKQLLLEYNKLARVHRDHQAEYDANMQLVERREHLTLLAAMKASERASRSRQPTARPKNIALAAMNNKTLAATMRSITGSRDTHQSLANMVGVLQQMQDSERVAKTMAREADETSLTLANDLNKASVHHIRNPSCTLADAPTAEAPPAPDDEPCHDSLYVQFDVGACNYEHLQQNMTGTEDLFYCDQILAQTNAGVRYHSTTAQLPLEDATGKTVTTSSVVDSGAAACAIDLDYRRQVFPDTIIRPSNRRFLDAQKKVMDLEGEMEIHVWVGDLRLATTAFVFRNLGAKFLLGNNALTRHGLTISNHRGILFSEMPNATAESRTPIQSAVEDHPTCNLCSEQCQCDHHGTRMVCDMDGNCFQVTSADGTATQVPFTPEGARPPSTNDEVLLRTSAHTSFSTAIKPGRKLRIRLDYDKLYSGAPATAELTLLPSFERWLTPHGAQLCCTCVPLP